MSQLSILLALIGLMSPALASLSLHGQPLLSGVTSYALAIEQLTKIKPTTCYITEGEVTQCRRKRGMVERPIQYNGKGKIVPSTVVGIETTTIPRDLTQKEILAAHNLFSSMDDSYFQSQNIFKQLANRRRSNVITVGNCGMSTVNLVDFLSCLGMTVQETTTLTATFTETHYSSSGYTVMTVMGCTPAGFPYLYCPANLNEQSSQPSKPSIILEEETLTHTTTYITTFPDGTSSSYIVTDQTVIITDIQEPSQAVTETEILPSGTEEETIQTSILPSGTEEETVQTSILPSVVIEQSTITNTVLTIVQTTVTTVAPTSTVLESPTTVTVDTEELATDIPEIESSTDEIVAP
ncbi:mucin-5AC-like isoform X2 [Daphnia pulex]|uniref:mucin-5AC-like isoform X2 n=1 Tax=Daphnia pulex TaxID=6669 RepID=UPI001EDD42FB|nr:mucin-5AC-like isoform X2 [Daphnia pulex]